MHVLRLSLILWFLLRCSGNRRTSSQKARTIKALKNPRVIHHRRSTQPINPSTRTPRKKRPLSLDTKSPLRRSPRLKQLAIREEKKEKERWFIETLRFMTFMETCKRVRDNQLPLKDSSFTDEKDYFFSSRCKHRFSGHTTHLYPPVSDLQSHLNCLLSHAGYSPYSTLFVFPSKETVLSDLELLRDEIYPSRHTPRNVGK